MRYTNPPPYAQYAMLEYLINEDTELFEIVHYFAGFAEGVILARIGKKEIYYQNLFICQTMKRLGLKIG